MERANDDALEISLEDAHKINKDIKIGELSRSRNSTKRLW